MADVYLREHPNPNKSQYHSPRRQQVSGVFVVHTAENTPDYVAFDGGAEAVARYISVRDTYGSYHFLADSDSILHLVRWGDEAYHDATSGGNRHEIGGSIATRADAWEFAPKTWRDGAIDNLAVGFAEAARYVKAETGIVVPARRITRAESEARKPGFISHALRDPKRRSDPGWDEEPDEYLWELFLERYRHHAADVLGTDPEDTMNAAQEAKLDALAAQVKTQGAQIAELHANYAKPQAPNTAFPYGNKAYQIGDTFNKVRDVWKHFFDKPSK